MLRKIYQTIKTQFLQKFWHPSIYIYEMQTHYTMFSLKTNSDLYTVLKLIVNYIILVLKSKCKQTQFILQIHSLHPIFLICIFIAKAGKKKVPSDAISLKNHKVMTFHNVSNNRRSL